MSPFQSFSFWIQQKSVVYLQWCCSAEVSCVSAMVLLSRKLCICDGAAGAVFLEEMIDCITFLGTQLMINIAITTSIMPPTTAIAVEKSDKLDSEN